jgi:predicted ATPase
MAESDSGTGPIVAGSEIPQATLANIRAAIDAVAAGAYSKEKIAARARISARHVGYVVAAAKALGLIRQEDERLFLSSLGRRLSRAMPGGEEEGGILLQSIRESEVLQRAVPTLLDTPAPTVGRLVASIRQVTDLAPGTSAQRAAMMLQWRRKLLNPQLRIPRDRSRGMWRRIEIANFRSIEHADVILAPFTLVVGPNGSGKSNFADALVFARDIAFDASAAISSRGGISGVRRWRPFKPTDVSIDIRSFATRNALKRTFSRHFFRIHSGRKGNWTFSKELIQVVESSTVRAFVERNRTSVTSDPPKVPLPSQSASVMLSARQFRPFLTSTSPIRNVRRYRLNPDSMRAPQLSSQENRLAETGENIAAAIQSINAAGSMQAIVEPMAKIVPGLQEISVEQVGRFLALKFKQMQEEEALAEFNATEMSEGALRALGIIVATHQMERDELLIIEEPEVSIHVGAATLLFDILKEASSRGAVLLTTHSADLLDAAKDEEILVCDYRSGATKIGPLSRAQRELVKDGLFSVAELMRSEPLRIEGAEPLSAEIVASD